MTVLKIGRGDFSLFILSIFFCAFIPIIPGWNFFYGHIFFALWCGWIGVLSLNHNEAKKTLAAFSAILILTTFYCIHFYFSGNEHRFSQDSAKIIFFLTLLAITTSASNTITLQILFRNFIILFPFVFAARFLFFKEGDWFEYSGRLYDDLFGSPNVVGTFCGLAIIFIIFYRAFLSQPARIALIIFYSLLIILGFSRSAIIATTLSVFLLFNIKIKLATLLFVTLLTTFLLLTDNQSLSGPDWILQKANILKDIAETGGSGRIHLWLLSIEKTFSNINIIFFGQGPGRVIEYMDYDKIADHPHNFYLFILLGYGLPSLVVFLVGWVFLLILAAKIYYKGNKLPLSLIAFYSISFSFDTHILASQFIVPHILVLSILFQITTARISQKTLSPRPAS